MHADSPSFADWSVEFHSGIPVYKQIVNRICSALAGGTLKEGDRLPTIRQMHEMLNVNPNTVAKAYRELELKGVIAGRRGSGCFMAASEAPAQLSPKEIEAKVTELFNRMIAEANGFGITEEEVLSEIARRNQRPQKEDN